MKINGSYDYIIVGAGSAGCVLANRLSASPEIKVLLVEAGPTDYSLYLQMPAAMSEMFHSDRFNWMYQTDAEPGMDGRNISHPRGRVLGGSSSINGMALVRGHALDYEKWASNTLPTWSYAHCLPYFRKLENYGGDASDYRGTDGPMRITVPQARGLLWEAYVEAYEQAGFSRSEDTNGFQQEGFGPMDQTIHEGRRWSTAVGYLNPVKNRKNLTIATRCMATKILFEGSRAVGMELLRGRQLHKVYADREVILSAGAVNSPQLLMLSGVGEAAHLSSMNIPVVADLEGVGKNLQDHMTVFVQHGCTKPVSLYSASVGLGKFVTGLNWLLFKKGAGASNHFHVAGYVRSHIELNQPDLQFVFLPLTFSMDDYPASNGHSFEIEVLQLQPTSRGEVKLKTPDPKEHPIINGNYLTTEPDRQVMRDGIRIAREIFSQKAFEPYRGPEIAPGENVQSDSDLDAFVRRKAEPNQHLSCTCRMGIDDQAVVDEELRVRNLEGIRVVDASVMPTIPSGNTNASVIMIAEKAADIIANKTPLEPVYLPFQRPDIDKSHSV